MTRSLPAAALFAHEKTYAPRKVWRGSTPKDVKPVAFTRKEAVRIWHDARRFYRQTRGHFESRYRKGKPSTREGIITAKGLMVLQVLLFDFSDRATGSTRRLDPCYATLAERAGVGIATVARALRQLKEAGIISWVPRFTMEQGPEGGWLSRQLSNLYGVIPSSSWRGFKRPPDPPPPDPDAWGKAPGHAETWADLHARGGDAVQAGLEQGSPLEKAIASLGARLRPPRPQ